MKRDKLRILAVFLLFAVILLSACGSAEGRAAQYKIYLITKSTSTEFWRSVFAGANAARAEYNVNLTIRGPDTEENYAGQNMYIKEAIRNHADAIVFSAISYTENASAIDEAAEAGIKIVVITVLLAIPFFGSEILKRGFHYLSAIAYHLHHEKM